MKISTAGTAALVAASVLAALAPSQAFAAPQAPPCTKKNIAYLDAQDRQEDAEAKVTAAEKALDRARADRAQLDKTAQIGEQLIRYMQMSERDGSVRMAGSGLREEFRELHHAAAKHDPAATADAAVKLADVTDKELTAYGVKGNEDRILRSETASLRTAAESARKAVEAPNVEARQSDVDTARSELTEAAKKVRPARDVYRDCLDKLVN